MGSIQRATVKLDDRWVPCDGSFTKEALQLMAEENPAFHPLIWSRFAPEDGFSMMGVLDQAGGFDVHPVLTSYLPNMDPGNMEAMNILLDTVQGAMYPQPMWIPAARNLLAHNPRMAYLKVYANILSDVNSFLHLLNKGGPDEVQVLVL